MKRMKRIRQNVHRFVRTALFAVRTAGVATQLWNELFTLSILPNYTEFTNLYDFYRIRKVKWYMVPTVTENPAEASVTNYNLPTVHTVLDYNDYNVLFTLNDLMQYRNYKAHRGHRIVKRYFTPAVANTLYNTANTSAFGPKFKQWISTDNPNVSHYGVRYLIEGTNLSNVTWNVYHKVYFECKATK